MITIRLLLMILCITACDQNSNVRSTNENGGLSSEADFALISSPQPTQPTACSGSIFGSCLGNASCVWIVNGALGGAYQCTNTTNGSCLIGQTACGATSTAVQCCNAATQYCQYLFGPNPGYSCRAKPTTSPTPNAVVQQTVNPIVTVMVTLTPCIIAILGFDPTQGSSDHAYTRCADDLPPNMIGD